MLTDEVWTTERSEDSTNNDKDDFYWRCLHNRAKRGQYIRLRNYNRAKPCLRQAGRTVHSLAKLQPSEARTVQTTTRMMLVG